MTTCYTPSVEAPLRLPQFVVTLVAATITFFCIVLPARAQTSAPATTESAATEPVPGEPLTATVVDVAGNVRVRASEDQPWQKAVPGMILPEGGEFQTGPRSAVRFSIPGGQLITLDRLGVMKILTAVQQQGKIVTDLGMKYGRTRYDIKKAGVEYSSTIRSPGSTLAIRGTDVTFENQAPWVPSASSAEGRAAMRNLKGNIIAFGGTKKADISADHSTPGQTALDSTHVDPNGTFSGHDSSESKIITDNPAIGGLNTGSAILSNVLHTAAETQFIPPPTVPVNGPLAIDLIWASVNAESPGKTPGPTNLDLVVVDPLGNIASKDNPTIGTGNAVGTHTGDHPGTTGAGVESVVWPGQFPEGKFQITVNHVSGDQAQVAVLVTRANEDVRTIGRDPKNPLILSPGQTFTTSVDINAPPVETTEPDAAHANKSSRKHRKH